VLRSGALSEDSADILARGNGVSIATSDDTPIRERSGGSRIGGGDLGGLGGLASPGDDAAPAQDRVVRGRVQVALARTSGDRPEDEVLRLVRMRMRAVQACYERELRATPTLAGTLTVHFRIDADGTVGGVTGDGVSSALDACTRGIVARMRWQPPVQSASEFDVTFTFTPQP
jgi:hypothetical protein